MGLMINVDMTTDTASCLARILFLVGWLASSLSLASLPIRMPTFYSHIPRSIAEDWTAAGTGKSFVTNIARREKERKKSFVSYSSFGSVREMRMMMIVNLHSIYTYVPTDPYPSPGSLKEERERERSSTWSGYEENVCNLLFSSRQNIRCRLAARSIQSSAPSII